MHVQNKNSTHLSELRPVYMRVPPQVLLKVHNRSTAEQIFCICQTLEKSWIQ